MTTLSRKMESDAVGAIRGRLPVDAAVRDRADI